MLAALCEIEGISRSFLSDRIEIPRDEWEHAIGMVQDAIEKATGR